MRRVRVDLDGVSYRLGGTRILDGIDVSFETGTVTALLGPSGSGKTTLLRIAAGLARPTAGEVRYDGRPGIPRGAVKLALQDDPVYANLDVEGNLGFPLDIRGVGSAERDPVVAETARTMGVGRLLRRPADALSGGERAAVSVGRTLVETGQRFVLLDEPLARADRRRREAFAGRMRSLVERESALGLVVATNDPSEMWRAADRVVVIDRGRVLQQGPAAEVVERPADTVVAGLVGDLPMNLFPATIARGDDGDAAVVGSDRIRLERRVPERALGGAILLGVWPGDLSPARAGTPFDRVLHGTVAGVDPVGAVIDFGLGPHPVAAYRAVERRLTRLQTGDRLELTWRTGRYRLFTADTGQAIPE